MGVAHAVERSLWLRNCESVGEGVQLFGRPSIFHEGGAIAIGAHVVLRSRPVASHFVAGPGATLRIGDRVVVGHGAAIAAYERVDVGAGTAIGPFAIIMDTNFHGAAGDQSVRHDCRPIVIGTDCRIGARVTLTRGVELGDGARVLAGSVVSTNVPARMCAGGARARIVGPASGPGTSWDGAFALLPVLAMDALGLDAPPDRSASLFEITAGDAAATEAIDRLAQQIRLSFGVSVDRSVLTSKERLADIAAVIEERRRGA
jgi:acetyltransferase-like isoleucine patch superfamily enzyme